MRVWAEVAAAVVLFESGETKARPLLRQIDPDHEESLIVAKGNVVTRPIFLDQFALEQNRFRFAADRVRLKIPCRIEQGACFQIGLGQFRRQKIRAHALTQVACFADVNHAVEPIAHQVHTGLVRHLVHFLLKISLLSLRRRHSAVKLPEDCVSVILSSRGAESKNSVKLEGFLARGPSTSLGMTIERVHAEADSLTRPSENDQLTN